MHWQVLRNARPLPVAMVPVIGSLPLAAECSLRLRALAPVQLESSTVTLVSELRLVPVALEISLAGWPDAIKEIGPGPVLAVRVRDWPWHSYLA